MPLVNGKTCRTSHAIEPSRGFGAYTVYPFQQAMLHRPPRYPIVFGDLSTYFHSMVWGVLYRSYGWIARNTSWIFEAFSFFINNTFEVPFLGGVLAMCQDQPHQLTWLCTDSNLRILDEVWVTMFSADGANIIHWISYYVQPNPFYFSGRAANSWG